MAGAISAPRNSEGTALIPTNIVLLTALTLSQSGWRRWPKGFRCLSFCWLITLNLNRKSGT
jgi:hypothetical protein